MPTILTTGDNNFSTAKWIVNKTAGLGTHTTIASALTSAASGDTIFVMPGTYTENPTLKAGVNLSAYSCDAMTPNVTISGNCTFSTAGTISITGINLQTNSGACLTVGGSAVSIVNISNCNLNALNTTGLSYTTTNASSKVFIFNCTGDVGTTGIALFAMSSTGTLNFNNCKFTNTGASTTANTISAGAFNPVYCVFKNPVTTSSTGAIGSSWCTFDSSAQNITALTHGGTGGGFISFCEFSSGTASAISIGTGAALSLLQSDITSGNTNAITGVGSITYSKLTFSGTSQKINTTTTAIFAPESYPSFLAHKSANTTLATGDSTVVTVLFDTVDFDTLTNYTAGTGTFTAPAAGKYFFSASVSMSNLTSGHTSGQFYVAATSRTVELNLYNPFAIASAGFAGMNGSCLIDMSAGDTCVVKYQVNGSTKTVTTDGGATATNSTFFSGFLVH